MIRFDCVAMIEVGNDTRGESDNMLGLFEMTEQKSLKVKRRQNIRAAFDNRVDGKDKKEG